MDAPTLVQTLRRQGIGLVADGDRLRYHPKGALTPALEAQLRRHKWAILALLSADDPEVRRRAEVMRRQVPEAGPLPFLTTRDVPRGTHGCLSCGDPLPPARGEMLVARCLPCVYAAQIVTDASVQACTTGERPQTPQIQRT